MTAEQLRELADRLEGWTARADVFVDQRQAAAALRVLADIAERCEMAEPEVRVTLTERAKGQLVAFREIAALIDRRRA